MNNTLRRVLTVVVIAIVLVVFYLAFRKNTDYQVLPTDVSGQEPTQAVQPRIYPDYEGKGA